MTYCNSSKISKLLPDDVHKKQYLKICSDHFPSTSFKVYDEPLSGLNWNAVPSLTPPSSGNIPASNKLKRPVLHFDEGEASDAVVMISFL